MSFLRRHVGSSTKQVGEIIKTLRVSQRELIDKVIPGNICINLKNMNLL